MALTFIVAGVLATIAAAVFLHLNHKSSPEDKFSEWEETWIAILIWVFVGFFSFVFILVPVLLVDHFVTANYHDGYTLEKQGTYAGEMRSFEMAKTPDASGKQVEAKFAIAGYGGTYTTSVKTADLPVPVEINCQEIKSGELPHVEVFYEVKSRVNDSILSALTEFKQSETVKHKYVFYSPSCTQWSAWEVEQQA